MLNLEILRISLIRQAPGRMGPPLRSLATFPASPGAEVGKALSLGLPMPTPSLLMSA